MMNLKTRYNLWKLKRAIGPSMVFKAGLRKNLNTAWNAKYGNGVLLHHLVVARVAGSLAMITMLLTGGSWVYAYTSPEVTEGSVLYPVKEAIETVEEIAKITPEAKAKFYLKKIERRKAEREVLEKKINLPEAKEEIEVKETEQIKSEEDTIELKKEKLSIKQVLVTSSVERKNKTRKEVKLETKNKIKRTEKSIERIEEELEKTRQIMEKAKSKDIKLREELRIRAEQRLERLRKEQESLQQFRHRNGERENTSSIKR